MRLPIKAQIRTQKCKREVRSYNEVCALFAEHKVRFARAEQLRSTLYNLSVGPLLLDRLYGTAYLSTCEISDLTSWSFARCCTCLLRTAAPSDSCFRASYKITCSFACLPLKLRT